MPEEVNRVMTDAISDMLWTPSPDGDENLLAEGVAPERIERIGNIMLDSYEMLKQRIVSSGARVGFGLTQSEYAVVTLHRPSNVDERATLGPLVDELCSVAERLPIIFAVHPRTRNKLTEFGLLDKLAGAQGVMLCEPLSYIEFMNLVSQARVVISDSGGVQEETTYLNIPCLTVRENTERPITITQGTNRLISPKEIRAHVDEVLDNEQTSARCPDLWDGKTAIRATASLARLLDVAATS